MENAVLPSFLSTAPTAITLLPQAGVAIAFKKPLLPDAAKTTTPLLTALLLACARGSLSHVLVNAPPPRLIDMIFAPFAT
ncbi:MAG: hypothetical protein AABX55_01355, partial [Nanoarchaeota archaeon]